MPTAPEFSHSALSDEHPQPEITFTNRDLVQGLMLQHFLFLFANAAVAASLCGCQSALAAPNLKDFWPCHLIQKSGMPLDLDEYSVTSFRNMDDLSSNNRTGVSNSATRPAKVYRSEISFMRTFHFTTPPK